MTGPVDLDAARMVFAIHGDKDCGCEPDCVGCEYIAQGRALVAEVEALRKQAVEAEAAYDALYEEQTADLADVERLRGENQRLRQENDFLRTQRGNALAEIIGRERDEARGENQRLREEQKRDLADVDRFRGRLIAADDEVAALREALRFYADYRNHESGRVALDLGERARHALDGKGGP